MNVFELSRGFASEVIGSFWLAFSFGWTEKNQQAGEFGPLHLALAQFAAFTSAAWVFLPSCPGALNPGVTASLWRSGRVKGVVASLALAAQFLGALMAVAALGFAYPSAHKSKIFPSTGCFGCLEVQDFGTVAAIVTELLGGFLLVLVYFASVIDKRGEKDLYGPALGSVFLLLNAAFGSAMNIGINPLRFLAAALMNLKLGPVHVYLAPALIGGLFAGWVYEKYLLVDQPQVSENKLRAD